MLLCPRTRKLFVGHKLVTCFLYPMTKYIKIVPRDLKKKKSITQTLWIVCASKIPGNNFAVRLFKQSKLRKGAHSVNTHTLGDALTGFKEFTKHPCE